MILLVLVNIYCVHKCELHIELQVET